MRTITLNVNLPYAGRRRGLINSFRALLNHIGKSAYKRARVALVIVMGVLFLFSFNLGLTLLALKIFL